MSNRVFEIGSEFTDVPVCEKRNSIFSDRTKWFLSGRVALRYIINDCDIKSVSMPLWCCDSMVKPFVDAGVEVFFYDKSPSLDKDAILLMDYFGFEKTTAKLSDYKGVVIRDVTHSLFSHKYNDADYYYGSLRKWAGFITGGFAWGKWKKESRIKKCDETYVSMKKKAIEQKKMYLSGEIEDKEKTYLSLFREANNFLDKCDICGASDEDIFKAHHLDVDSLKKIRRKNAQVLLSAIKSPFKIKRDSCPLFVPIFVERRDDLRNYLIDHNVFCPVHWPNHDLKGNELSLICDQRYSEKEMRYICELIQDFYRKVKL